jgi:hypothetical protein
MQAMASLQHCENAPGAGFRATIRSHVGRLDQRFDCVVGCRVRLDSPRQPDVLARLRYRLVIECDVPGRCLTVSRTSGDAPSEDDIQAAIADAFAAMHAALEDHVRFYPEEPEAHARYFR